MTHTIQELITRYDKPGPRYTGYPMPPAWNDHLEESVLLEAIEAVSDQDDHLSLYIHLPFCKRRCSYCGCNVVISPQYDPVKSFLETLDKEADLWKKSLVKPRKIIQMHWGGGTPNYLNSSDLSKVFYSISSRFQILPSAEVSIEIDPTFLTEDQLPTLKDIGFNRVSFGVQDMDPEVQELITRGQTADQTIKAIQQAKSLGFKGINIDLVYGLPGQTLNSFEITIKKMIELKPSRLAIYGFAYLPSLLPFQKSIPPEKLPQASERLNLLLMASDMLEKAGYVSIGMDHFSSPSDDLTLALNAGKLGRNFMGYAPHVGEHMVSMGPSAISNIGNVYHQNHKNLNQWTQSINEGHFAMSKGIKCTSDDLLRRWVIHTLMSEFKLIWSDFEAKWNIDGKAYFRNEIEALNAEVEYGTVLITNDKIEISEIGKRFIRNLVMPFDRYLTNISKSKFSQTV
ncbi:oxygen-independent coproporphyrinogen III oxidase [Acidobacteriota bacterium]|nr:oxygen-independent coproporphyrinogen III oxidase [Acidobacteriota bacterium]